MSERLLKAIKKKTAKWKVMYDFSHFLVALEFDAAKRCVCQEIRIGISCIVICKASSSGEGAVVTPPSRHGYLRLGRKKYQCLVVECFVPGTCMEWSWSVQREEVEGKNEYE